MSVGCEGGGDVCGYGEALVDVLVGIVRPSSRERPKWDIELCSLTTQLDLPLMTYITY